MCVIHVVFESTENIFQNFVGHESVKQAVVKYMNTAVFYQLTCLGSGLCGIPKQHVSQSRPIDRAEYFANCITLRGLEARVHAHHLECFLSIFQNSFKLNFLLIS